MGQQEGSGGRVVERWIVNRGDSGSIPPTTAKGPVQYLREEERYLLCARVQLPVMSVLHCILLCISSLPNCFPGPCQTIFCLCTYVAISYACAHSH